MIKEKKVLTRFAPSPTGDLHIGNARSAILNWIYSKQYNVELFYGQSIPTKKEVMKNL